MRNVSPSTIERVRAKALEMGYRRNYDGSKPPGQGQQDYRDNSAGNHNTLSMEFVTTVQEAVQPLGYRVLIAVSSEDPSRERQNLDMFENGRVDGLPRIGHAQRGQPRPF